MDYNIGDIITLHLPVSTNKREKKDMAKDKITELFTGIYGETLTRQYLPELLQILEGFSPPIHQPSTTLDESDAILITYGDALHSQEHSPLGTLGRFLYDRVGDSISTVHLLPFFPYSSDDGFSVIDFTRVDPALGDWKDIQRLGETYDLMFDAVINHISVKSDWFQGFLAGDPTYRKYFITVPEGVDLSAVFRPRALPLLTKFNTSEGVNHVWTTFSSDQVDLNYANPAVLLDVLRILLLFVERGARFIRLDAIAFIWKELGTSCLHLANAHRIVQLFHAVFDALAPYVQIITETNVPHEDNVAYFGDGTNEAQLVYNFSLPPLVLHAFHAGNTRFLSTWAKSLSLPSRQTSFFNFLASHDGIGVTPARGLIPDEDLQALCRKVEDLGGYVSYKTNADGSHSPYELNINFLDALTDPEHPNEPVSVLADRFLASQSIMLALRGVPGIYYHSLIGSRSWAEGVAKTGRKRTINREKLRKSDLLRELGDRQGLRYQVFSGYLEMLNIRRKLPAFSPRGRQEILDMDSPLFSLVRTSPDGTQRVLCITNVTGEDAVKAIPGEAFSIQAKGASATLLARNATLDTSSGELPVIYLGPYGVLWVRLE